jgi:3-oxoacyl-[acyl-carrier-protein] synthase-3
LSVVYLRNIKFVQPATWVSSEQVEQWTGGKPGFIAARIGVERRAFLGPEESATDLALQAAREVLAHCQAAGRTPELVICVTQNPDFRLPHMSALLQHGLGLPDTTMCFDVGLGCSGFVYALSVARGLLLSEQYADALIVTCDPYSRIMAREDRDTLSVFGDGAACAWLSREAGGDAGLLCAGVYGTDGGGAENLIVRNGGARHPLFETVLADTPVARADDAESRLYMNGRAILEFMLTRVPGLVAATLDKNSLRVEDIDHFVFHQASSYMLQQLTRYMKLPAERVPIMLETTGNTVSSTIPYVLAELAQQGRLQGKRTLLCGFGVGLSWGACVLDYSKGLQP